MYNKYLFHDYSFGINILWILKSDMPVKGLKATELEAELLNRKLLIFAAALLHFYVS